MKWIRSVRILGYMMSYTCRCTTTVDEVHRLYYCGFLLSDEFNCVRFCAYRTAMKLRQLQRKLRCASVILAFDGLVLSVKYGKTLI